MPDLDIVIPLYRSRPNLAALIDRLNAWTASTELTVRVIFVDDGSPDSTFDELPEALKNTSFSSEAFRLAKNYGQHAATAIGFHHCTAPLVVTMDDDLQHDPFQLEELLAVMKNENADLVYGIYRQKKHSLLRNIGTLTLKKILLTGGRDYSSVTSFRLMKSPVVSVLKNLHLPVMFVDEYLLEGASRKATCLVTHEERNGGSSGYSGWKLFTLAMRILLFHSAIPLKLITRFGILMSVAFFGIGCYYIYQRMMNDVQLGFTSLIVAIFFSTGMILLSLGIIGEYVRRIWVAQHNLDKVIIAQKWQR